jgi:hypothetical protein
MTVGSPPLLPPQAPPPYQTPPWQPAGGSPTYGPPPSNSKAGAAQTLGIISIFFNVFYIPGILAIVWGRRERHQNSKARTGFVCGIIGTCISVLGTVILIAVLAAASSAVNTALKPSAAQTTPTAVVGQASKTSGFNITVYGFKDPQPPASQFDTPASGDHFVSVDVQVNNPGSSQETFSSLLGFHLLDSANRQYDESFAGAGVTPGPPEGQIAAGQSIRGFVVFEVPDGTTGLRFRAQGSITAAGAVWQLS